ncbi:hypothetical protein BD414DRAFT_479310 [Trametes punicea]|nr:hypothetical protein BD414DRAFT_479310 [Trametes punicea]
MSRKRDHHSSGVVYGRCLYTGAKAAFLVTLLLLHLLRPNCSLWRLALTPPGACAEASGLQAGSGCGSPLATAIRAQFGSDRRCDLRVPPSLSAL